MAGEDGGGVMRTSVMHELKVWPEYFKAIMDGVKSFEIRKNDRDFSVGDELALQEFDPDAKVYTGNVIYCHVTYILSGGQFGIDPGYVAMGIVRFASRRGSKTVPH